MCKNHIIPIALICDENYVMPTSVVITSLIENKLPETYYDIHIFGDKISQKSKDILKNMEKENIKISIHDIENKFNNLGGEHVYVSKSAYIKFDLQNLLPQYDKLLYIDSDVLVTNDLTTLYNTDIKTVYAGVVEDMYATLVKPEEYMIDGVDKFFNSGVMLLNTKKLRDENITLELIKNRKMLSDITVDNMTFVYTFKDNVRYLSPVYNYMNPSTCFINRDYYHFYNDEKFNTSEKVLPINALTIIHFTAEKPWNYACYFYWEDWIKYFKKSPFKELKLKSQKFKFFRREKGKHLSVTTILGKKFWKIK